MLMPLALWRKLQPSSSLRVMTQGCCTTGQGRHLRFHLQPFVLHPQLQCCQGCIGCLFTLSRSFQPSSHVRQLVIHLCELLHSHGALQRRKRCCDGLGHIPQAAVQSFGPGKPVGNYPFCSAGGPTLSTGRQLHAVQVPCDEIDAIRRARAACAQPKDGRLPEWDARCIAEWAGWAVTIQMMVPGARINASLNTLSSAFC